MRLPIDTRSLKRHPSLSQLAVFSRIFFVRENAIKPAFLLSFGCIYEKSCLISCGLGATARVLGHNGPKVLLELILTKSSKGLKPYRFLFIAFHNFFTNSRSFRLFLSHNVHKNSNCQISTTHNWSVLKKNTLSLKFIYSEKATKLYEIFTLLLSYVVPVKSKVKILWPSQNIWTLLI